MFRTLGLFALLAVLAQPSSQPQTLERLADGIRLQVHDGYVSIHVKTDSIVRVTFSKTGDFRADDMVVIAQDNAPRVHWTTASAPHAVTLTTPTLRISVARADGAVT